MFLDCFTCPHEVIQYNKHLLNSQNKETEFFSGTKRIVYCKFLPMVSLTFLMKKMLNPTITVVMYSRHFLLFILDVNFSHKNDLKKNLSSTNEMNLILCNLYSNWKLNFFFYEIQYFITIETLGL